MNQTSEAEKTIENLSKEYIASKSNIVLCGFMGCGKSSIGRRLASIMGRRFVDMDAFIEERAKKSVREIFAAEGEEAFRRKEEEAALELSKRERQIIAAGGGTVLRQKNREALSETGIILMLDVPLPAIRERLKNDTVRPLLQRPDRNAAIEALYLERTPQYLAAADAVVPAGAPANVIAREIASLIGI